MPDTVADEPKVDKKAQAEVDKKQAEADKAAQVKAAEQAKQDDADIETFLAFHRGERLLRGGTGSFDPVAYAASKAELAASPDETEQKE